jgi:hypothetical protein
MIMTAFDELDLDLAWRRLKHDRPDRTFVSHPFLMEIIESDLEAWINTIRMRCRGGEVEEVDRPHE